MYNNGYYDNNSGGILLVKSDISDYLSDVYTLKGKYVNGIRMDPVYRSILANNIVKDHLYRLFDPIDESRDIYDVINNILDTLSIKQIRLDEMNIDVMIIMLENEIKIVLKHVYKYSDDKINRLTKLPLILNSIKNDLLFINSNIGVM